MSLGRIGSYDLLERLGEGGMGVVFKAHDSRLDRIVALKVVAEDLASDPEYRARLVREAKAEAGLSHPAIATCFDVGEAELDPSDLLHPGLPPIVHSVPFLAMEYIPGDDLSDVLERRALTIREAVDFAIQIAAGLEAAHASGVIHRDIKPGNIRVLPDGRVKILDFGLARIAKPPTSVSESSTESLHTSKGRVMGTVQYMAPEQASGQTVDVRSDLFSLGALIYHMVAGHAPFTGETGPEVIAKVMTLEPPPLARFAHGVPDELERIVDKLLAKQPRNRYQSAHELVTDLTRLREVITPASSTRLVWRTRIRRRRNVLAAAGVAIITIVALYFLFPHAGTVRNIAVLDFENARGDSSLAYMAGLADDILNDLVQYTNLNVVTRAVVSRVQKPEVSLRELGRELGVRSLLLGFLQRDESGPRLIVQLVDARNGQVRWSNDYRYSIENAFRIKQDIVTQVADHLSAHVDRGSRDRSSRYPSPSIAAYDLYLQGMRQLEDADDPQSADRASELLSQALMKDPDFALAWARRGQALARIYARDKYPESLRSAEEAVDQALLLAPDLLEARLVRVVLDRMTGRTEQAIAELKQVLKVKPNWDEAYLQLARSYRDAGRLDEAEDSFRRAVELRPDYWRSWNSLGALLITRGDYEGAQKAFKQIVRIIPDKNRGYEQLAALHMMEGNYQQAIAEYRRLPAPVADAQLASNIGSAYYYAGRLDEALTYCKLAVRLEPENAVCHANLGDLYLKQGNNDEARTAYRAAVRVTRDALRASPRKPNLLMNLALFLAKSGDCGEALSELSTLPEGLTRSGTEFAYLEAKVSSLCDRKAEALAALRKAIEMGVPPARVQGDDEFRPLRRDSEYIKLMGSGAVPTSSN